MFWFNGHGISIPVRSFPTFFIGNPSGFSWGYVRQDGSPLTTARMTDGGFSSTMTDSLSHVHPTGSESGTIYQESKSCHERFRPLTCKQINPHGRGGVGLSISFFTLPFPFTLDLPLKPISPHSVGVYHTFQKCCLHEDISSRELVPGLIPPFSIIPDESLPLNTRPRFQKKGLFFT